MRLFASRRPGRLFPASADVVFYLSFRLSVHLSVRCVSVCAPVRLSSGGPPVSFVCVRRPRLLLVRSSSPLSLAYVVCYLSFRLSVHLSVRPCFCLCACSPVVGNTSSSMSACADFGHPTHPGPHRFSHPAKSKFFSFLSDSEGNGKNLDLPPRPKGVAGALKSPTHWVHRFGRSPM